MYYTYRSSSQHPTPVYSSRTDEFTRSDC